MMPGRDDEDVHGLDDLAACPWAYPGTAATCSGLLEGGRFTPRPACDLLAGAASRTLVVAVGSNASPAVMHRKLARHGVSGPVPLVAAKLTGCAVGHSAHVSVPGFVPAAPYLRADACTPVYATLLDRPQLRCVDASEPSYVRRRVARGRCVLELDGGTRPASFALYDGRWGVLAPPDQAPVPFGSQQALHALLRLHWPLYEELLDRGRDDGTAHAGTGGDADDDLAAAQRVIGALAADEALRTRVREAFAATGWTRDSGLAQWTAA
jgi:hypothetical protein